MEGYQLLLVIMLFVAGGVKGQCGKTPRTLFALNSVKTIRSVNYPFNYNNNMECAWILRSSPGTQVEAYFLPMVTEECCDYLEIRDGNTATSAIVAKWRGNITRSLNVISTFGALYIKFVSDETITAKGFQVQFRRAPNPSQCGSSLRASSRLQRFTSPNFPTSNYPSQAYCVWTITAPVGQQVQLTVWYYELESCCDNLLVRDGTTKTSTLLAYRRGRSEKSTNYTSTGGVLQVRFRSDASFNFRGFNASYKSVRSNNVPTTPVPEIEECGDTNLKVPPTGHGFALTPGYGDAHPSQLMCVWIISTTPGRRIRVWFGFIHTEECCDWVKIRDGPNSNSRKLGLISGNPQQFASYVSTSNVIRVEFDSDQTANGLGVSFYYENYVRGSDRRTSTCGGALSATSNLQYFSSPNWPNQYNNNTFCTWVITARPNQNVDLLILGAITERLFDFIRIYEGPRPNDGKLVGTLHGKYFNRITATSKGRQLTVVFESDSSTSAGGFRASYSSIPDKLKDLFGK